MTPPVDFLSSEYLPKLIELGALLQTVEKFYTYLPVYVIIMQFVKFIHQIGKTAQPINQQDTPDGYNDQHYVQEKSPLDTWFSEQEDQICAQGSREEQIPKLDTTFHFHPYYI